MTKRRNHGPVSVKHTASGETFSVPRDEFIAGRAEAWILQQIQDREAAARDREKAAAAAELAKADDALRSLELEKQLAARDREIAALREDLDAMRNANPEAASVLQLQMQQTKDSREAFDRNQKLLAAFNRFVDQKGAQVMRVAELIEAQNATLDEEKQARIHNSHRFMDQLRIQQGLEPLHPELLSQSPAEGSDG